MCRALFEQVKTQNGAMLVTTATPAVTAFKQQGWAIDEDGKRHVINAGPAVPATRLMYQGLAFTPLGQLYCIDQAPAASATKIGGLSIRQDGALHVSSAAPGAIAFAGLSVSSGRLHESGL